MAQKLQQQLRDVGSKLENPPVSKDALIKLLKQTANYLSELDQSPLPSVLESMQPCLNAIAKPELLRHQDKEVKVIVALCICEITRITAPEAPYSDEILKDIFHLIVGTFHGLNDIHSSSFGKRVLILETLARYRSCLVMLDLECDDLINEMFRTFFAVVSDEHAESVLTSMQTIIVLILEEGEDIPENLLFIILSTLGRKNGVSLAARKLAMTIIQRCAVKLEPYVKQFLVSLMSGDSNSLNMSIDYHEIIYDMYQCAPQMLCGIVPYITGELLTDDLDVRLKAVQLLGNLFSLPEHSICESFRPLLSELLKRLTDRVVEVRILVIEHAKNCLISNPSRPEASEIISLCDRLLDYDEQVRKQVVAAVYDVACHDLESISSQTAKLVAERLRDKSLSVKRYTMKRLAEVYKLYCLRSSNGSFKADDFEWIPGKILRCLYDKDFRPETIELIMCGSMFPTEFTAKDKVKHWIAAFSRFDKIEVKALEQLLAQKQRIQQEMHKYLAIRQTCQDSDAPELYKRVLGNFRTMSRLFSDPVKAEESFQILNQVKDVNIWKILMHLLDPCTGFRQAWTNRDDLFKILGEKHPLYEFMETLSLKCSYLIFNKEYTGEMFSHVITEKPGDPKFILSSMNLLAIVVSFCPLLLGKHEDDLVNLLKEDNDMIKEGTAHILAKGGGTIREQLTSASSSVELLLEGLCLGGTRGQAKYSVQALSAITEDDGLKALSVLYKRLVDMLEKRTHLPAVLQSLGYIAQTAMPVFETREDEIIDFVTHKILECSNETTDSSKNTSDWNERSELCSLKIFGIKTLVRSYLPTKDAHLRLGIENLLGILKTIILSGEISDAIMSSTVDKAHLRLASAKAILRLSRLWESKISVDLFYLLLRMSQDTHTQCRRLFLNKVHQYIKERLLDPKYACAFLFHLANFDLPTYREVKQNLIDIVQVCNQVKARQISLQSDHNSCMSYPEYILVHLVHALAHDPAFPNVKDSEEVQSFEIIYWRLHLFLSALFQGEEVSKSVTPADKSKGSFCTVVSVLQTIIHSEDVVNKEKSKNLYALCDIGLLIVKRLSCGQVDVASIAKPIPLPEQLYKIVEKDDENSNGNENQVWKCRDKVLTYLESLDLEKKEKVDTAVNKDEVPRDSDEEERELPLGKIMQTLKSQGAKKRKRLKKKTTHSGTDKTDNDLDLLGMVREINLDNQDRIQGFELNSLEQDDNDYLYKEHTVKGPADNVLVSLQKENKDEGLAFLTVRKRKRSSLPKFRSRGTKHQTESKKTSRNSNNSDDVIIHLRQPFSSEENIVESADSELLTSSSPAVMTPLSVKKGSHQRLNGTQQKSTTNSGLQKLMKLSEKGESGLYRSAPTSTKKHKRRRISGLQKCSSVQQKSDSELVGCRIKVWWPLDKKFYEGVVQSYDPKMKKHVVLYDDGDLEVLMLNKEKWELASPGHAARKKLKRLHAPPFERRSQENPKSVNPEEVHEQDNDRRKRKTAPRKQRGRQKKLTDSKIGARSSDREEGIQNYRSDDRHRPASEVDVGNSGEDRHPEPEDEANPEEDASESGGEKREGSPVEQVEDTNESDGGKPDSSGAQEEEGTKDREDSDDEPLSVWRQRAAK